MRYIIACKSDEIFVIKNCQSSVMKDPSGKPLILSKFCVFHYFIGCPLGIFFHFQIVSDDKSDLCVSVCGDGNKENPENRINRKKSKKHFLCGQLTAKKMLFGF